jgi:hypothetical protein
MEPDPTPSFAAANPDRRCGQSYSTLAPVSTRAHHHFTGVDADASFERVRSLRGATLSVFTGLPLHLEGGIEGSLWMVLIGGRSAEQREDTVPVDCTT